MVTRPGPLVLYGVVWLLLAFVLAGPVSAQDLRLDQAGGMAGLNFYDAGEWGLVRSVVANDGDQPADALVLISLKDAPAVRYGNRVRVPARSRREVLTMLTPHGLPPGDRARGDRLHGSELDISLAAVVGDRERRAGAATGIISVRESDVRSAVASPDSGDEGPIRMHGALRAAAGLSPATVPANPRTGPADPAAWGGLDVLVLARGEGWSPAQVRAMRHWVHNGGRLWVMLDQTGPSLPSAILGEDWVVSMIDRVEHTELTLRGPGVEQSVAFDYPIDMVRVAADAPAQTLLTAAGYPAALSWRCGRGRVLVTTLASAAWLDEQGEAGRALAATADFLDPGHEPRRGGSMADAGAAIDAAATQVRAMVGHRVLGRGTVVAVLGVFLLVTLAAGLWLHHQGRLEWAAPVGVAAGLVAAAVLITVGWRALARTPGVTAVASVLRHEPAAPTVDLSGLIGIYRQPGAGRLSRVSYHGPPPVVDDALARSSPRLLGRGLGRWSIENVQLSPGEVHTLRFAGVKEAQHQGQVVGELDAHGGLRLRMTGGHAPRLQDTLLMTPAGHAPAAPARQAAWLVDASQPMSEDQFIDAAVLSQRQMQRAAAYAQWRGAAALDRAVLVGWTDQPAVAVDPIEGAETRAQTLAVYRVRFEPPPPGQRFRVPSVLLTMAPYRDREIGIGGTVYDPQAGWIGSVTNAQTIGVAFELPESLRGMDVQQVELALDLHTPGRAYELLAVRDGRLAPLHSARDAAGLTRINFDADNLPTRRDDGSVLIVLRIGDDASGNRTPQSWTITSMDVDLIGAMPAR